MRWGGTEDDRPRSPLSGRRARSIGACRSSFISRRRARLDAVLRLPARGGGRHVLDPARRGERHARCSAPRWPRSSRSSSSRAALDRVGARAAARHAGLRVHAVRARARRAGHPLDAAARSCVFTLVLYPYVYLLARAAFLSQSRTLIEAARGLGMSRAPGDPAGGRPARAAGDPRRRGARADGGARRLRHRQPARRAHLHRRDLPRLVRRVRPRRGDAVRHAARVGHAHAARARAARARARPPRPARGARRRSCRRCGCAASAARPPWCFRSRWSALVVGAPLAQLARLVGAVDPRRACCRSSSAPRRATACCSPA